MHYRAAYESRARTVVPLAGAPHGAFPLTAPRGV